MPFAMAVLEQVPVALSVWRGPEHVCELANDAWVRALGPAVGRTPRELFSGADIVALWDEVLRSGEPRGCEEHRVATPDGFFRLSLCPLREGASVAGVIAVAADITDHVRARHVAEELLREAERMRLAADAAEVGTFALDVAAGELWWDERSRELFGFHGTQPRIALAELLAGIHVDDRALVEAALSRAQDPRGSDAYAVQYRMARLDTGEIRWLENRGRVTHRAPGGAPLQLLGTIVDVTDRKRAERERQLLMAALGHDLRNPLQGIRLAAETLLRRGRLDVPVVQRIVNVSDRMARLIGELLDFSRISLDGQLVISRAPVELRALVDEAVAELQMAHPEAHVVVAGPRSLEASLDGDRVRQVVQNLVENALRHGARELPVQVRLLDRGTSVQLEVENGGPSIAASLLPELFEPFRRGERNGPGLGLGLFIVREVARAHGGSVSVVSEGGLTRFTVDLPRLAPR